MRFRQYMQPRWCKKNTAKCQVANLKACMDGELAVLWVQVRWELGVKCKIGGPKTQCTFICLGGNLTGELRDVTKWLFGHLST
jgi:hypothetical protein